jgi:hypothetical protein
MIINKKCHNIFKNITTSLAFRIIARVMYQSRKTRTSYVIMYPTLNNVHMFLAFFKKMELSSAFAITQSQVLTTNSAQKLIIELKQKFTKGKITNKVYYCLSIRSRQRYLKRRLPTPCSPSNRFTCVFMLR